MEQGRFAFGIRATNLGFNLAKRQVFAERKNLRIGCSWGLSKILGYVGETLIGRFAFGIGVINLGLI